MMPACCRMTGATAEEEQQVSASLGDPARRYLQACFPSRRHMMQENPNWFETRTTANLLWGHFYRDGRLSLRDKILPVTTDMVG
jgi:hypothetical protein